MSNLESINAELIKNGASKYQRFDYLSKLALKQKDQFEKLDMMKSLKKTNPDTYIKAEHMTPTEIEEETKKDILEANKNNLSDFNKKLKKGLNYNPEKDKDKK